LNNEYVVLDLEINIRTKKIKTSRHFIKLHIKTVLVELKRRYQAKNFAVFVEFKRKKQDCLQFSKRYQEIQLFCGYFSHLYEFFSLE
jgi:hypothetical protein